MFLPLSVCHLYVCLLDYSINYELILKKSSRGVKHGPSNNRLHFGGDLGHDLDRGFLDQDHFLKDSLFPIAIPIGSQE